ncbi:MAG: AI-2E family transporter [Arachnia sp.]
MSEQEPTRDDELMSDLAGDEAGSTATTVRSDTDASSPAPSEDVAPDEAVARGAEPQRAAAGEQNSAQDSGPSETAPVQAEKGRSRAAGVVIAIGATALSIWLLREFSSVVAPIFLGANLLIAAYPVYTLLLRIKVPRVIAAIATGLTVLLVLLLGVAALVWSGTSMVSKLTSYSDQFTGLYQDTIAFVARFGFDETELLDQLTSISPSNVLSVVQGIVGQISSASSLILVVLVILVFMVMDLPSMAERMKLTNRLHPAFTDNLETFISGIRRYWLVTTIFGVIVAVLDGLALVILGVSLPVVWAVLSLITNYIPNIGFVIGLVPPALLALVEQGPVTALLVVLIYSVLNFVLQSIVQPKFTGDAVGITPTVSFISLLLWAAVFGPLGALIALPFTLMIKAMLIDNDPQTRWVNVMIAARPEKAMEEPS